MLSLLIFQIQFTTKWNTILNRQGLVEFKICVINQIAYLEDLPVSILYFFWFMVISVYTSIPQKRLC